jgi:molecular chaperone HtpG
MPHWSKRIPFKVDISGIIDIMGASLYSRADTPIRELIQNSHDGIMRRRQQDLAFTGQINIKQDAEANTLSFTDDGIGLSAEEAEGYLGTLGVGITGMIKKGIAGLAGATAAGAGAPAAGAGAPASGNDGGQLIGQFGVGLFSAFMLAEQVIVESKKAGGEVGIRWEAGLGTDIELSTTDREQEGTTVTLVLKSEFKSFAANEETLEKAIREYADFVPVPIFLNDGRQRANVINVAWFDPTPDNEAVELALENYFDETPLDVIPLRTEKPISIAGALYVTPRRTPGFSDDPTVTVTVRRMVISRKVQGLIPEWCLFLRGVLELNDCSPTASREDLVRNERFHLVREILEDHLFDHFEQLAENDLPKLQSIIAWHRYSLAGAGLSVDRLRLMLRQTYRFPTSLGQLTFEEIFEKSESDPLFETDAEFVIWYNTDRRQERWANGLFDGQTVPCVHTLLSFEESLLAAMTGDKAAEGNAIDLRVASPSAQNFAETILGIQEIEPVDEKWQTFFGALDAKVLIASFQTQQPVMAFLNERRELRRTFDELKKEGTIPAGFQRLIDNELSGEGVEGNEVLLNRNHRLVARALEHSTGHPLGSVLRILVLSALNSAGASVDRDAYSQQADDLDWIAEALWGRSE